MKKYEAIKDLIDETLNGNPNGILFDTTLFNSKKLSYTNNVDILGTLRTQEKQVTPAHITEINARYINIPNTDAQEANIGIEFDVFIKDSTELSNVPDQTKYESVSYNNTLLAINNLQKELLAKKYTLGDSGLYFGGEDSGLEIEYATSFNYNTIYIKADLTNTDDEDIFYAKNTAGTRELQVIKDATDITFVWNTVGTYSISGDYTTGMNEIVIFYDSDNYWNLYINGVLKERLQDLQVQGYFDTMYIGNAGSITTRTDPFEGVLYQVLIDVDTITSNDVENVEETVSPAAINLADFDSRYTAKQNGSFEIATNEVTNCVLWGSLGSIVFSFEELIPIGDMFYNDEGYPRQMFYLNIPCLISNDLMFGNSTEYYIDGVRMYPVDRQHTFGTEYETAQKINKKFGVGVVNENMKDMSHTFFYKPSKQLNKLFKHIVSNTVTPNKVYELVVQYPFYRETYDVNIDSGGSNPNLNEFQTITVTYKQADELL